MGTMSVYMEDDMCVNYDDDSRAAQLEDVLRSALYWLENAPLDYSNGVTHQGMDEGNVRGWKGHNALVREIKDILQVK